MTDIGEVEQEEKVPHPGWQPVARVVNLPGPFFDNCLFMSSYSDYTSHIYAIQGEYLSIVDPGNDYTAFMDLWDLGFKPENIKKIVLTHGHPDHWVGGVDLLRSYPEIGRSGGLEFVLHGAASPRIKQTIKELGATVTEVSGGEILDLSGVELEVIHTPGHTIDGICLYHAPTKTVFTGDMVLPLAMAEPDPKVAGRLDHYLYGIKELLKRDIDNVFPGHGPLVAPGGRRVVEDTYEALLMRIIGVEGRIPWVEGAKALAQKGLLDEAIFCCDKALVARRDNLSALEMKAMCLNDLGRCAEAIEAFDKVLAQKDDHVFALTGKGCALLGLGRYEESLSQFDSALQVNPRMKEAQVYKGMALYLSGAYDAAMDIEAFRTEFVGKFKDELLRKSKPSTP
jgi:glyoxylase-like metal-dependent hydrolase (beta-lactamase superfamily II)